MTESWIEMYKQGQSDVQIARNLGLKSPETIRQRRIKLRLPSKFDCSQNKTIDESVVRQMCSENKTDSEIAQVLGVSSDGVYALRKRLGINRESLIVSKSIELTQLQKEFIVGCVLGDGNLRVDKNCINPRFTCEHGEKQREYAEYKFNILQGLNPFLSYQERKTPDKRNGNMYKSWRVRLNNNPELLWFYNQFYSTGKKQVTEELMEYYTPFAIAIHFMDDGTWSGNIATNSFSDESINILLNKLLTYDIMGVERNNTIVFSSSELRKFNELIRPYIITSMIYKLKY